MRVSEAVVEHLVGNDIDVVFGLPGKQTLPLNRAIEDRGDIEYVMARHETAVSHQAWGYAETTGRPAATVTIPGPGDMNAMNGLKNALNDCTPLVHLSVETDPAIRGGDGIHETPPEAYDTVVKENTLVRTPESTVAELERAVAVATTPPRGPVRIGIPKNFLGMDVSLAATGTFDRNSIEGVPGEAVTDAAGLLSSAARPIIVAGGGVRAAAASAELERVAEGLAAPVVTTYKGKGVLPDDHPLVAGTLAGSASQALLDLVGDADVALGVGTDFDAVSTRAWSVPVPDDLVHVTHHAADVGTGYEPTVGLVGDAKAVLAAVTEELQSRDPAAASGRERVRGVRERTDERLEPLRGTEPPVTSVSALEALRAGIPREAIVTADAGGFRVWLLNTFDVYGPRSYVNPGSWATMGTGLPSGIGAQVANPDRSVVVLTGDGGLLMCLGELHTAVEADLPVTVVVVNNNDYAIISEAADRSYGVQPGAYAWPDAPIDFCGLAESVGMATDRAETPTGIRETVAEAVAADVPRLVEVTTDPDEPQASEWMAT